MRLLLLLLFVFPCSLFAQDKEAADGEMKTYYMVFLKRTPDRPVLDSAASAQIQQAHINHLEKMSADGKMSIAGPFMDDNDIRGICIYNTPTMEEAVRLANSDPAVKAGRLIVECR